MEKKRKLPARAAARVEQASKKRTATPPEHRSVTPAPAPATTTPAIEEIPAQPLPKSIQSGKPLPTVEDAQPDELSAKEYQSVQESGVLAESLHRSRQRWISEGIFQKYWSKPSKRKGVVIEEPNNPAKDTMIKLGQVVITVEPHVFEATMFAVKDPNPKPPVPQPSFRPIMQYGPPNGAMPPPPTPTPPPASVPATPAKVPATLTPSQTPVMTPAQPQQPLPPQELQRPPSVTGTPLQQPPMTAGPAPVPAPGAMPVSGPPPPPVSIPAVAGPGAIPGPPPQMAPGGLVAPAPAPAPAPGPASAPAPAPVPVGAPAYQQPPMGQPQPHPHMHAPGQPHVPAPGAHPIPGPVPSRGMASSPPGMHPMPSPHATPAHNVPRPIAPGLHMPQGHMPAQSPSMHPNMPVQSPSMQPHMPQKVAIQPAPAHAPPRPNGVAPSPPPGQAGASKPAPPAHAPGTDPIIVTLAERATEDPQLRDLMKRVANGHAPKHELDKFQKIIDEITAESRRKGAVQGPSADRLLVDGRTVRYFAEEVRAILDIVFRTNPKQTSADLRPPAGSDPLVVLLVKAALDEAKVQEMVRRIADNRPQFSDATDLKAVLDRLKHRVVKDQERPRTQSPAIAPSPTTKHQVMPNGRPALAANGPTRTPPPQHAPQQALRSKGPPPAMRTDISAIVFEFAGGSGDRYLFPKFSILDFLQTATGQQAIASFLIVRKGSTSEYGGDPALDYYQPVTIRLSATSHRHLENLARVVAPQDEVQRYMDNIMDNMTRAEYILLAMRLPRKDKDEKESSTDKEVNGVATKEIEPPKPLQHPEPMQGVMWTTKVSSTATPPLRPVKKQLLSEEDQYQSFIASLTPREVDEV